MTTAYAVDEARRNVARKYPDRLDDLEAIAAELAVVPEPDEAVLERAQLTGLPDKDVPILAAALAVKCAYLVTGDETHFGDLYGQIVDGLRVLPPTAALEAILSSLS